MNIEVKLEETESSRQAFLIVLDCQESGTAVQNHFVKIKPYSIPENRLKKTNKKTVFKLM